MKVLHVVQGYFPAIGGTERVIQLISERLVSSHGDDVTVYTTPAYNCELFWRTDQPSLPVGVEEINGVTVRRFPVFNRLNTVRRRLSDITSRFKLPYNDRFRALLNGPLVPGMTKAIAASGADVIGASSFPLMHMHYALHGGRKAGIPVVYYGGIHPADDWGFNRPMIYKAIRQVDAYISYTTFERDFLIGRGVPSEKITPVGVGVDPEPFEKTDGAAIRRRFRMGDDPVVAFVGQQVPHKGIETVVDAMIHVWGKHPSTRLLIAGSRTTYSEVLAVKISRLSTNQKLNVHVFDNFEEEEKPSIFAASDILAFPSRYESFGIVFIEAWSSGLPVIGLRVDAVTSVVDDGVDGLLVMPDDPEDLARTICELLENKERRVEMGAAGRRKVHERYTWDIIVEKCRKVYQGARSRKG
jgi:glycosyltransferase involved in cell wall biosynthesis